MKNTIITMSEYKKVKFEKEYIEAAIKYYGLYIQQEKPQQA